ncbi:M2 family metallopeptidase [Glacieibacterium sp.]|uniref:M2 family metallopeptidase n=1 Tax=Glacieibacterium sp. TaxID=2860237 RepID=UPI003B0052F0
MRIRVSIAALATALLATGAQAATVPEVQAFVADAELRSAKLYDFAAIAGWVYATNINDDTGLLAARAGTEGTQLGVELAKQAAAFNSTPGLDYDTARKLGILRNAVTLPATADKAEELNTIATKLQSIYATGTGTYKGQPKKGNDLEALMGTERDPALTKEMWVSWHDNVGKPMKADYVELTALANAGAKELGYADTGASWRSGYDMPPEAFAAMVDKVWLQVKPLYDDLHCYTRTRLNAKYGDAVQAKTGPIRADLLGNMWAQEWGNIYDVVAPKGAGDIGYDTGELLVAKGYTPEKMWRTAEGFYTSLGFAPLPDTFWKRSQIVRPEGREVVCHANAGDYDNKDDLRIQMCTKVNGDDFVTIHHEMGHSFYQRAYNKQPYLYLNGANDGFHEAIGDFVALSITPEYLVQVGLLDKSKVPDASKDTGLLLKQAMDKVAFLPFGLMIDKWRWDVFSGKTQPADYTKSWNDLRLKYQGIFPPVERGSNTFDPGAKNHVATSVPYVRYFLARILQFQFYQAACKQAGWKGPLHRCSFYGNKAVGAKLNEMLAAGASKPWPETLEKFTGSRDIDGRALLAYFAPLQKWLKVQNKGQSCGWASGDARIAAL